MIVTGLVSFGLASLPLTQTAYAKGPINSNVIGNNNNVVISNSGGGRGGHYRNNRGGGGGNGGALVAGLIGGALLYSALDNNRGYNRGYSSTYVSNSYGYPAHGYTSPYYTYSGSHNYRYGPRYGYGPRYPYGSRYRTNVVYVQQPPQTIVQQVPVYVQSDNYRYGQNNTNYVPQNQQVQNNNCLQSREYTTTISVGGKDVDAYGQACLQPDGSWKFGDPIAVPN